MLDANLTRRSIIGLTVAAAITGVIDEPASADVATSSSEVVESWINPARGPVAAHRRGWNG
jgi:hypothetical protein